MTARRLPALIVFIVTAWLTATGESLKSGLDLPSLDRSVRPQDDLYLFANGGWLKRTEIPRERVTYGTWAELAERTESDLRSIIESLRGRTRIERQIKDLYASVMDEQTLEMKGPAALKPQLQRIEAISSVSELAGEAGYLSSIGVGGPFPASAGLDARDPQRIVVTVLQGGTLLPDRVYYLDRDPQYESVRAAYADYLASIFRLAGWSDPSAARAVVELETELARAQQPQTESQNPSDDAAYTMREVQQQMPGFDWQAWGKPQGFDNVATIVFGQPEFFKAFAERTQSTPLRVWKSWLAARYITASAQYVNKALHETRFEFFGRVLTGQQFPRARWKQAVAHVTIYLGDALGRLYVEKQFSNASRKRVKELVDNVLEAYRQGILEADWMTPRTRQQALDKLARMKTRIGYPDAWRDYRALDIRADDLLGNVQRAQKFENDYRMAVLLGRTEPEQWVMTPQTINATYVQWSNEIQLPAAILQPPMFDVDAEDAVNYGGIGAILGHEIGHAFDQRGRRVDAAGAARDWWTARDEEEFRRRAVTLSQQFIGFTGPAGAIGSADATLTENIGDLNGLGVAVRAYRLSLRGKPSPVIDDFTGEQRVFLRWAHLWRSQLRKEYQQQSVLIDRHAPPEFRANGIAANLDAFHAAFNTKPGDKLFLAPEKRVRLW